MKKGHPYIWPKKPYTDRRVCLTHCYAVVFGEKMSIVRNLTFIVILVSLSSVTLAEIVMKFAWGSSKATISERITKNDQVIELKYVIEAIPEKNGNTVIAQSKLELISVNGHQIDSVMKNQLGHITAAAAMPKILIDKYGNPIDIIDFDNHLANVASVVSNPNYTEFLKSAQARSIFQTLAIENWCYWVCSWVDLDLETNKPLIETQYVEMAGMKIPQTTETLLLAGGNKTNEVELVLKSRVGGKKAADSINQFTKKMIAENNLPVVSKPNEPDSLADFEKIGMVSAIINPYTLKPTSIFVDSTTTADTGSGRRTLTQKKEFSFVWH